MALTSGSSSGETPCGPGNAGVFLPHGKQAWPAQEPSARAFNPLAERLRRDGLPPVALVELDRGLVEVRSFPPGAAIIREGVASTRLHILLEGWGRRTADMDCCRQTMSFLLPGDVCDLNRLRDTNLSYGVGALTRCRVAVLDIDSIRRAASTQLAVAAALLGLAFDDHAASLRYAASLGRRSAPARLAYLICELWARTRAAGLALDDGFMLPATQQDLGEILRLTNVHVNRTLKLLRGEALLKLERGKLTILDWERLAQLGAYTPPAAPSHS